MPNIIEWGDWQAAQGAVQSANKAVSGLTPAQAEAAMKFTKVTLQDGTVRYVMNSVNTPQPGAQINFDTGAVDAAYEYVNGGGQVSQTGAAVSGPALANSTNMAMTQASGGITSVGALLSVNLPTVAAAIAPIAGVALGAGLYSLNPELWEKISRALLPFCYEDSQLLPVVADEAGNTYFPKDAIDAVTKELSQASYEEAGQPGTTLSEVASPVPFTFYSGITTQVWTTGEDDKYADTIFTIISGGPVFGVAYTLTANGLRGAIYCSSTSFRYDHTGYYNRSGTALEHGSKIQPGKKFYTYSTIRGERLAPYNYGDMVPSVNALTGATNIGQAEFYAFRDAVADEIIYGDTRVLHAEGVSEWTGVKYPLNPEGIGVVTRISADGQIVTTNPYYPVTMPVGDPGVSPSPIEVPQPGTNPEVAPAVDPWLTPDPNPNTYPEGQPKSDPAKITNPVPDTDPNLDPNANPSQQPEAQPDTATDQSTKPGDGGASSLPIIPIIPTLPSATAGLLHVYNPTQSQIDAFGSWLWTTFSGDLIDTISKLFNDPMDAVIGLHELYATPAVSGSSTIRAGFLDSGVSSNVVGSRYTTINCGSIVVQEYYQNYLDYSPYTKCYIYLPFVGIVPVLADDIIGNAVNVTYHVDSYTGCCIAVVTVARSGYSSTVYQFEGNCAVEIPITSGYQSTLMGALIGAGATALTGNPHAGIAAANMGRASLGKNDVSHSGSFGSSYGAMGAKVPYIIVKRPTQKSVVNYNQDYGFPAHKRVTIGACSGYLRAREVHVISPTATDDEKARIEELLKEGVFVK